MPVSAPKPILISGAGLASLLLGQALRRASLPFIIFERDQDITFRAQGYRLRLSSLGLDAIEAVLSPEDFQRFWDKCGKTGGSGFGTLDALTGEEVTDKPSPKYDSKGDVDDGTPKSSPREALTSRGGKIVGISRGDMRKLFLSGCEANLRWSHNVTGYEVTSSGVHAIFSDGSKSEEGSMLIGGEGIHSKVAKQLSNGKLKVYDTGARGIHGQAPYRAFKELGEGVWRARDDSRLPDGSAVYIITNVRPETDPELQIGWTMGAHADTIRAPGDNYALIGKPAADIAKSLTEKWHPKLRPLFTEMNESEAAFWKITCSTPSGVPQWKNEPRVTLIGDAVHSMTPAGGLGANTAVRDSALLGRLLGEAGGFREGLTEEYEKEMRVYGSEAVAASYGFATSQMDISIDEETTPTV